MYRAHSLTTRKSTGIHNLSFKFYLDISLVSRNLLCYDSVSYVVSWYGWSEALVEPSSSTVVMSQLLTLVSAAVQ